MIGAESQAARRRKVGVLSVGYVFAVIYASFGLLNRLTGTRLHLSGEGTWVSAIAAKEGNTYKVLLTNYDPRGRNSENVPLTLQNVSAGRYNLVTRRLGQNVSTQSVEATGSSVATEIPLTANQVTLV